LRTLTRPPPGTGIVVLPENPVEALTVVLPATGAVGLGLDPDSGIAGVRPTAMLARPGIVTARLRHAFASRFAVGVVLGVFLTALVAFRTRPIRPPLFCPARLGLIAFAVPVTLVAPSTDLGAIAIARLGSSLWARLAAVGGLGIGALVHDPEVVLRMLIVGFSRNTVPRGHGITRQCHVLFIDLMGVAPDAPFRARTVKTVRALGTTMLLAIRPPARPSSVWSLSHQPFTSDD
jgi:hypothetical protein